MAAALAIPGRIVQLDAPCWEPIVEVLASELPAWFMWMFEAELANGTRLQAYKHVATRRYLLLDADGRAYTDDGTCGYLRRELSVAIAHAFAGWERAAPGERDTDALRAALGRARHTAVIGCQADPKYG